MKTKYEIKQTKIAQRELIFNTDVPVNSKVTCLSQIVYLHSLTVKNPH